jgi:hypothetical protein
LTSCWAQPLKITTIATNKTAIPTFLTLAISVSFQKFPTKLTQTRIFYQKRNLFALQNLFALLAPLSWEVRQRADSGGINLFVSALENRRIRQAQQNHKQHD